MQRWGGLEEEVEDVGLIAWGEGGERGRGGEGTCGRHCCECGVN